MTDSGTPDGRTYSGPADAAAPGQAAVSNWWVCDGALPPHGTGQKITGPFATQELALSVRAYVEKAGQRSDLWVDDEPAARQPHAADGLLEPLHALAAKWDATAARNQRNGQSLLDQGDEYGSEGLAVAEALGACVVDLRAVLADAPAQQPAPGLAAAMAETASRELAAAMAEARGYRNALQEARAIILEGGSSTEGSRLRRSRAVIRKALEGK